MAVDSTSLSGLYTNNSNSSKGNDSLSKLATDFSTFLTLLTTQLKHQSPTDPMDTNAFTQELVQFTSVQQQVQTNLNLESILSSLQSSQINSAASYVGTTVQAEGELGALVKGEANFGYTLPAEAAKAQVQITNSEGMIVFIGTGSTDKGSNLVKWDGKNSFTGAASPEGVYSIKIKATDANGKEIEADPFIVGKVTSASLSDGEVILSLSGLQVPARTVKTVTGLGEEV